MPAIRCRETAALWSMVGYPEFAGEYDLDRKLAAIAEAGFDSVFTQVEPGIAPRLASFGLELWAFLWACDLQDLDQRLNDILAAGATRITVHLGRHDTPVERALEHFLRLDEQARRHGVLLTVETHRDTATETPEKFTALAAAYRAATGRLLPVTWDFSHLACVKHLHPSEFASRLLAWPELIQSASLFHCRPFNSQHCQVPVTRADGSLTPEVERYLAFVDQLFALWLAAPTTPADIWLCPEMGPADELGYNLSTLPNSWRDATVLRPLLRERWQLLAGAHASKSLASPPAANGKAP